MATKKVEPKKNKRETKAADKAKAKKPKEPKSQSKRKCTSSGSWCPLGLLSDAASWISDY